MPSARLQPENVVECGQRALNALATLECPRSVAIADYTLTPEALAGEIRMALRPPSIGCIGPFDSGKSTLLNNLLESDVLPSDWQPVTSALVFINHISRRPEGLDDHVFLMGASFQARDRHSARAVRAHLVASGGMELLNSRARHKSVPASGEADGWGLNCPARDAETIPGNDANEKKTSSDALYDYVIVFIDRPALLFAEFVDTPGLGKSARDDLLAQQAISQCDLFLACHPPPAYGGETLQSLIAAILQRLGEVDRCAEHPFGRLLLVITHANSDLDDADLRHIRRSASVRIAEVHQEVMGSIVAGWSGASEPSATDIGALVAQRVLPFSTSEPRRANLVRSDVRQRLALELMSTRRERLAGLRISATERMRGLVQRAQATFERTMHTDSSGSEVAQAYSAICGRFERYENGLAIALGQLVLDSEVEAKYRNPEQR